MSDRIVVFDLDDTLYPERDFVRSGFEAAGSWFARERGVRGLAEAAWGAFERGVRGRTFDVALAELGVESEPGLPEDLVAVYRGHEPQIRLAPDAADCLASLDGPPALVSDGPWQTQTAKLRALGLDDCFDPAVLTARLGLSKPDRRVFELIAARRPDAEHVYVADNPTKDFAGPRELGWLTIRIRRPEGLYAAIEPAPGAEPDAEIDDLRYLARRLDGPFGRPRHDGTVA